MNVSDSWRLLSESEAFTIVSLPFHGHRPAIRLQIPHRMTRPAMGLFTTCAHFVRFRSEGRIDPSVSCGDDALQHSRWTRSKEGKIDQGNNSQKGRTFSVAARINLSVSVFFDKTNACFFRDFLFPGPVVTVCALLENL
ncbi:hypothetical protein PMIN06_003118 [Paraphaeosphaeria minitans]